MKNIFLKKPVLHCSISAFLFSTYIPDVDMVKTGWMRSVLIVLS